jgi:hypothetical protein
MTQPKIEITKLKGYDDQIVFEKSSDIRRLNEVYGKTRLFLTDIKKRMDSYVGGSPLKTEDGYKWNFGYRFKVKKWFKEGEVVVLFPKVSGTRFEPKLDRSVAIYTKGKVSYADLNKILSGITDNMEKVYHNLTEHRRTEDIKSVNE